MQFPRLRLVLYRLMDGELSSSMSPFWLVVGVVFLFWAMLGAVNGYLIAAKQSPIATLTALISSVGWWEIGCFLTAVLSFASARVWWKRKIVKAVVISAVALLLGVAVILSS